jgi:hypothetical protein
VFQKSALSLAAVLVSCAVLASAAFALTLRPAAQAPAMPQPTAEHAQLLKGVGDWEGTVAIFDVPGMEAPVPARESIRAIGGFWLLSEFHSEFAGAPYMGSGHIGYDPQTKRYVGTWVDSMSSFFSKMEGEYDAGNKAVVMRWDAPDVTGKITPHRSVTVEAGDARTMTFFAGPGEGRKTMVIELKRKK